MINKSESFNLIDEKWIPVLYHDGAWERVGIRDALQNAGRIRQIAANNPMDRFAIFRFLLALLYWCIGNPKDESSAITENALSKNLISKLNNNRDYFNLFGVTKRFCQSYPEKGKKLSANYLMQEIPTGTNIRHFRHSMDGKDGLCPSCCTLGLLRLPVFATSAGSGKSPGINLKPPIYVIPIGISLAETLRLSWQKVTNLGKPSWEEEGQQLPKKGYVPLLVGLTWSPRWIWLDNRDDSEANCASCGKRDRLVRHCVFAGKGSINTKAGEEGRSWHDPHVIYGQTKGKVALYAGNSLAAPDSASGQWANVVTGILGGFETKHRGRIWAVGFATTQNDKYMEAWEYSLPFPSPENRIQETIEKIKSWQKKVTGKSGAANRLKQKISKKAPTRNYSEILSMLSSVRPHIEAKAFSKVSELLTGNHEAWKDAEKKYGKMMEVITKSLSPGTSTAAVKRREDITYMVPLKNKMLTQKPSQAAAAFIARLTNERLFGPGELSVLRSHAGQSLDESLDGFDLFTGLWWPLRKQNKRAPRREVAWLVAKLYAFCPFAQSAGKTIARRLAARRPVRNKEQERFEKRFDGMLVLTLDKIEPALQWALDLIASKDSSLDWMQLTDDLSKWERESTRLEWAKQFLNFERS